VRLNGFFWGLLSDQAGDHGIRKDRAHTLQRTHPSRGWSALSGERQWALTPAPRPSGQLHLTTQPSGWPTLGPAEYYGGRG
jgi:hypothetical protein